MAQTISIPGRRVSSGETFRTDWIPRGGDCIILRVEVLVDAGNDKLMAVALETRGEDGTSVTTITATSPVGGLDEIDSIGVKTCLYLATTSTSGGNGSQEQVRVVVSVDGEPGDGYYVARIFPLIFFDSAKPY